jgi:hypothetical protein
MRVAEGGHSGLRRLQSRSLLRKPNGVAVLTYESRD